MEVRPSTQRLCRMGRLGGAAAGGAEPLKHGSVQRSRDIEPDLDGGSALPFPRVRLPPDSVQRLGNGLLERWGAVTARRDREQLGQGQVKRPAKLEERAHLRVGDSVLELLNGLPREAVVFKGILAKPSRQPKLAHMVGELLLEGCEQQGRR